MKQAIISLKKKLLLMEVESFDPVKIIYEKTVSYFGQKLNLIGKIADITEEQFALINPKTRNGHNELVYPSYYESVGSGIGLNTAKESFFSKLEAEGICFENEYKKPNIKDFELSPSIGEQRPMIEEDRSGQKPTWQSIFYRNYRDKLKLWQEAQEKVWSLDNCYIFEIL